MVGWAWGAVGVGVAAAAAAAADGLIFLSFFSFFFLSFFDDFLDGSEGATYLSESFEGPAPPMREPRPEAIVGAVVAPGGAAVEPRSTVKSSSLSESAPAWGGAEREVVGRSSSSLSEGGEGAEVPEVPKREPRRDIENKLGRGVRNW